MLWHHWFSIRESHLQKSTTCFFGDLWDYTLLTCVKVASEWRCMCLCLCVHLFVCSWNVPKHCVPRGCCILAVLNTAATLTRMKFHSRRRFTYSFIVHFTSIHCFHALYKYTLYKYVCTRVCLLSCLQSTEKYDFHLLMISHNIMLVFCEQILHCMFVEYVVGILASDVQIVAFCKGRTRKLLDRVRNCLAQASFCCTTCKNLLARASVLFVRLHRMKYSKAKALVPGKLSKLGYWLSDWVHDFSSRASSAVEGMTETKFGTRVA